VTKNDEKKVLKPVILTVAEANVDIKQNSLFFLYLPSGHVFQIRAVEEWNSGNQADK
jgi:hypothetical protein